MGKIEKMLIASEQMELDPKQSHVLTASKGGFLLQALGMFFVAGLMFYGFVMNSNESTAVPSYYYLVIAFTALYGIAAVVSAFTAKVTIDEEGISIPGNVPFTKTRIEWEHIEKAELTGIIRYRSYLSLLVKKIFAFIFVNVELHIEDRRRPGAEKYNFPIFQSTSDRNKALCLIRHNLGERFRVYSKNRQAEEE